MPIVKRWWPSFVTLCVVIYATLFPHPVGADALAFFPGYDKLIHAIMMGGLDAAILFDCRRAGKRLSNRLIVSVAFGVSVFVVADEFIQEAVAPERFFEWLDIFAGVVGIIISSLTAPPVINRVLRKIRLH